MEDLDDIIVFRQFDSPIDANIAKSKLDAFGIPCFLTEENMAALYPGQQGFIINVRLHIFQKDRAVVSQIFLEKNVVDEIPEIVCPRCHGRNIERDFPKSLSLQPFSSLMVLFFGVFMPHRKVNQCRDCDNEF
jgi:hypothetical protein